MDISTLRLENSSSPSTNLGEAVPVAYSKLQPFANIIAALAQARGDHCAVQKVVANPEYGDLINELWLAALRLNNSDRTTDREFLKHAAETLRISPLDLLEDLKTVKACSVRNYVPQTIRSENLGTEPCKKPSWFPGVAKAPVITASQKGTVWTAKQVGRGTKWSTELFNRATGTGSTTTDKFDGNRVDNTATNLVEVATKKQASFNPRRLAAKIRRWSEAHTSDVQNRLRTVKKNIEPTGLSINDLLDVPKEGQELVLEVAGALTGAFVDADQLITDVRQSKTKESFPKRIKHWSAARGFNIANLIEMISETARLARDPEAAKDAHLALGTGFGISYKTPNLLFAGYAGGDRTTYFASKRELDHGVGAKGMWSVGIGGALPFVGGGFGVSGRGLGGGLGAGWLAASYSEFNQEFGIAIPGWFAVTFGRDETHGPYILLNYNPSIEVIPGVGLLFGLLARALAPALPVGSINARIFHRCFGPIVDATAGTAKKLATAMAEKANNMANPADEKAVVQGWPSGPIWEKRRDLIDRGAHRAAKARVLLEKLKGIAPGQLVAKAGLEFAQKLGKHRDDSAATHRIIVQALTKMAEKIETTRAQLEDLGQELLKGQEPKNSPAATEAAKVLEHNLMAFDWIHEGLLSTMQKGLGWKSHLRSVP